MENIYKIVFNSLLYLLLSQVVVSQTTYDNLYKYWFYKERLKFFISPGDGMQSGESLILHSRNCFNSEADNQLNDFSLHQEPTKLSYYLSVLATEWYILNKNGQNEDAQQTENAIIRILNTFERLVNKMVIK